MEWREVGLSRVGDPAYARCSIEIQERKKVIPSGPGSDFCVGLCV